MYDRYLNLYVSVISSNGCWDEKLPKDLRGAILSNIQNDLPIVDRTRSFLWIFMSVIGVTGILFWNWVQFSPSFTEINTPNSVPAKSNPSLIGSSLKTLTGKSDGIPSVINFQDLP